MMKSSVKALKKVNNYEVYPKSGVAQTIMFQNMSSHYRRIYNAKPRVDTGPPFSHKPVKSVSHRPLNWNKKQHSLNVSRSQSKSSVSINSVKCSRQGCGEQPVESFHPHISKISVESKLRTLRVYHPPRRRVYTSASDTSILIKSDPEISVPEIPWIHTTEEVKTTPSKGSSSDSAYTEEGEGVWSGGESRGPTPVSDNLRVPSSDNLMYIKFVRGITDEVLRKGIFTNKALKKIFQSHIDAHKQYLNLRRMQEEVDKLQLELGIPKEDDLDNTDYGLNFTSSSEQSDKVPRGEFQDKELLNALSQLNISPSLKADIASSLGVYSTHTLFTNSLVSSSSSNLTKRTTFSSPLEVIYDVSHSSDKFDAQHKFPQSDDDSYEMLSEGSESRPLTPLGLAW